MAGARDATHSVPGHRTAASFPWLGVDLIRITINLKIIFLIWEKYSITCPFLRVCACVYTCAFLREICVCTRSYECVWAPTCMYGRG